MRRRSHPPGRRGPIPFAGLLLLASPLSAQSPYTLEDVGFLTGCWSGTMGALEVVEQWTAATGGVMLGTSRFLRDGEVVDWEFARLEADGEGVTLWPYPRGEISAHGFPLVTAGASAVFENMLHDFPVRIVYERVGADALRPRIEGRDGEGPAWSLRRTACPG